MPSEKNKPNLAPVRVKCQIKCQNGNMKNSKFQSNFTSSENFRNESIINNFNTAHSRTSTQPSPATLGKIDIH
jgi:hypothetical protein